MATPERRQRRALSAEDRQTLRFALRLAIQWEDTLEDSLQPTYGEPDTEMKKEQAKCRRNIKKFERLIEVLK